MTDCPDGAVRDLLPELVNDRLEPDVRRRVDAHVRDCADCQQEVELLRAMRVSLRRGPVVDARAIASAIPAYRAQRRAWGGWRAAAAVVLVAVGGTSVVVLQRESGGVRDTGMTAVSSADPGTALVKQPSLATTPRAIDEAPREPALGNRRLLNGIVIETIYPWSTIRPSEYQSVSKRLSVSLSLAARMPSP